MGIPIKGLDKLKASINGIDKFKQAFGNEALARVKSYTPMATGRLQAAWNLTFDDAKKQIKLTNPALNNEGVPYAIYVEYGTVHMRGAFMLHRTIAEAKDIARVAKQKASL